MSVQRRVVGNMPSVMSVGQQQQNFAINQDALYVCQLLAINPDDLVVNSNQNYMQVCIVDQEKGLSEKRQQLRYEHYEEKRQLKIKAIQNVLQKCHMAQMQANAGLPSNSEAMQVQALIDDLKRQQNVRKSQPLSPSPGNRGGLMSSQTDYKSHFTEHLQKQQLDRVMGKLEHWEKMRENVHAKKANDKNAALAKLHKKEQKLEKVTKAYEENIKETVDKIQIQRQKWRTRIEVRNSMLKNEENQNHKKGMEYTKQIKAFLEERRNKDGTMRHSESQKNATARVASESPAVIHNHQGKMRSTWKGVRTDRFYSKLSPGSPDPLRISTSLQRRGEEEEDVVSLKMAKFDDKLRSAEERFIEKQTEIKARGQSHALKVATTLDQYDQQQREKWEETFSKNVNKQLAVKSKLDSRAKDLSKQTQMLEDRHRMNQEKIRRQQDEEKRELKNKLFGMTEKIQKTEEKIQNHRERLEEHLSGKIEKKRLLFEDKLENERRMKAMRMTQKQAIAEKHLLKEKKISEMKRVWLNHNKEPLETLYGSMGGQQNE